VLDVPANRFRLQYKPHGHGDVHGLLHATGLAKRWFRDEKRTHVCFFQDTQGYLAFKSAPLVIGACVSNKAPMATVCVRRRAGDAQGALCLLRESSSSSSSSSSSMVINVEYNLLERLLEGGDRNDPATGHSRFPGNTNQFVLALSDYVPALERTQGIVPEFVNPKFANAARTAFKKPTRLECMMQDYPKMLLAAGASDRACNATFVVVPKWFYSPVKNNMEAAEARVKRGLPGACAVTGVADTYAMHRRMLRCAGARVEGGEDEEEKKIEEAFEIIDAGEKGTTRVGASAPRRPLDRGRYDVPARLSPAIVWSPSFSSSLSALRERLPSPSKVRISARSSLTIEMDASSTLYVASMALDGALRIEVRNGASLVVDSLDVSNRGWTFGSWDAQGNEKDPSASDVASQFGRFSGLETTRIETLVVVADGRNDIACYREFLRDDGRAYCRESVGAIPPGLRAGVR